VTVKIILENLEMDDEEQDDPVPLPKLRISFSDTPTMRTASRGWWHRTMGHKEKGYNFPV
jgi:hypothetical protein